MSDTGGSEYGCLMVVRFGLITLQTLSTGNGPQFTTSYFSGNAFLSAQLIFVMVLVAICVFQSKTERK